MFPIKITLQTVFIRRFYCPNDYKLSNIIYES